MSIAWGRTPCFRPTSPYDQQQADRSDPCVLCGVPMGEHYIIPAGLYWWVRDDDETGMSGRGRVAQVAVFEDGLSVLRWLSSHNSAGVSSTVIYGTIRDLVWVHGHGEKCTGHLEEQDDATPA